ncbi:hypothetical protein C8J57DRAFT_1478285 [Mycena rebaudengoi]|nr:hypothetical protein C8J57DRAFT_1478285 [Mycena rebaudengoi]
MSTYTAVQGRKLNRNHNFRFKAHINQHVNGGVFVPACKPLLHLRRIDCQKKLGCNALVVPSRPITIFSERELAEDCPEFESPPLNHLVMFPTPRRRQHPTKSCLYVSFLCLQLYPCGVRHLAPTRLFLLKRRLRLVDFLMERSRVLDISYTFRVVGRLGVNAHGLLASILQIRAITAVARPAPAPAPAPAFAGHRPRLRRCEANSQSLILIAKAVDAVHYRIYTPNGAVPVKAAASRPDPFVGRILARSVPPPHLAGMLKRRILAAEGLPDRTISVEESPKALLVSPSSPSSPSAPSSVSSRTSPSGTRRLSRLLGSLPSPLRSVSVRNGKLVRPLSVHRADGTSLASPSSTTSQSYYRSSTYHSDGSSSYQSDYPNTCNCSSCTASRITTNRTPYDSYPSSPSPPSPYQSITSTISLPSSTPDSASITLTSGMQIYASMYDSEPMRDDAAVVLTGDGRHGASSDNPLAVVFLEELSVEERKARPEVEDFASREIPLDRYVYYRLYNRDGETRSSAAFDSVHTALGRIERAHITPPATVDSLKSCIAKVEHKRIWKYADLYEGTAPRDPLGGSSSIGREMGMGGDVNSPLLLVQPERKLGLFNRPARMLKTRKYRQSEKLTYDILQGTMMQTDGVVKDSMSYTIPCDAVFTLSLTFGTFSTSLDQAALVIRRADGTCSGALQEWVDDSLTGYLLCATILSLISDGD